MRHIGKLLSILLIGVVVMGMTVWGMFAIYYANLPTMILRSGLAAAFGLAALGAFLFLPYRRRTLLGFMIVWAGLVVWWSTIPPSNQRDWQPEVAVLPQAARRVTTGRSC